MTGDIVDKYRLLVLYLITVKLSLNLDSLSGSCRFESEQHFYFEFLLKNALVTKILHRL